MRKQKGNKPEQTKILKEFARVSLPREIQTFGNTLSFKRAVGPIIEVDIPGAGVQIPPGSWASGVLAGSNDILNMTTAIINWSSKWGACFREYRVVGMRVVARIPQTPTNPAGEIWFWLDEKSSTTPTANDAYGARRAVLPLLTGNQGNPGSLAKLSWMPHDLLDLDFTAYNAAASDVYLKYYAAPGVTDTLSTTTAAVQITAVYRVQFRNVS